MGRKVLVGILVACWVVDRRSELWVRYGLEDVNEFMTVRVRICH